MTPSLTMMLGSVQLVLLFCDLQLHYYKQGKHEEFVRLLEASKTGVLLKGR